MVRRMDGGVEREVKREVGGKEGEDGGEEALVFVGRKGLL